MTSHDDFADEFGDDLLDDLLEDLAEEEEEEEEEEDAEEDDGEDEGEQDDNEQEGGDENEADGEDEGELQGGEEGDEEEVAPPLNARSIAEEVLRIVSATGTGGNAIQEARQHHAKLCEAIKAAKEDGDAITATELILKRDKLEGKIETLEAEARKTAEVETEKRVVSKRSREAEDRAAATIQTYPSLKPYRSLIETVILKGDDGQFANHQSAESLQAALDKYAKSKGLAVVKKTAKPIGNRPAPLGISNSGTLPPKPKPKPKEDTPKVPKKVLETGRQFGWSDEVIEQAYKDKEDWTVDAAK